MTLRVSAAGAYGYDACGEEVSCLTQSSDARPSPFETEPDATAPSGSARSRQPSREDRASDHHDGPDYVDDWMEENLEPNLVDFTRRCCTSFVRWDLLRRLRGTRTDTTVEDLARDVGASSGTVLQELEALASLGLVSRRQRHGRATYRLDPTSDLGQVLDLALRTYDDNREFRFALVYSIVKASHRGGAVD